MQWKCLLNISTCLFHWAHLIRFNLSAFIRTRSETNSLRYAMKNLNANMNKRVQCTVHPLQAHRFHLWNAAFCSYNFMQTYSLSCTLKLRDGFAYSSVLRGTKQQIRDWQLFETFHLLRFTVRSLSPYDVCTSSQMKLFRSQFWGKQKMEHLLHCLCTPYRSHYNNLNRYSLIFLLASALPFALGVSLSGYFKYLIPFIYWIIITLLIDAFICNTSTPNWIKPNLVCNALASPILCISSAVYVGDHIKETRVKLNSWFNQSCFPPKTKKKNWKVACH